MGLPDLQDVDPELAKGLRKLLAYDEAAPENNGASVADVFCLTFEVDWVEFDQVRRHELKPGGKDVEVTAGNRGEYVALYAEWVLAGSVAAQFEEFKVGPCVRVCVSSGGFGWWGGMGDGHQDAKPTKPDLIPHPTPPTQAGFNRVMGGSSISLLRPEELELLVCGTPHLNFHELEEVARYEGCVHVFCFVGRGVLGRGGCMYVRACGLSGVRVDAAPCSLLRAPA